MNGRRRIVQASRGAIASSSGILIALTAMPRIVPKAAGRRLRSVAAAAVRVALKDKSGNSLCDSRVRTRAHA